MTRDEYDAIPFDEAKVEFHRDISAGETYVTMNWSGEPICEHTDSDEGIKFVVSDGFLELESRRPEIEADGNEVTITIEQARALAEWSAETRRPHGCSGYGPRFDDAMEVAHEVRAIVGPSDMDLAEAEAGHG